MAYKIGIIGFGGMVSGHHLNTIRRDDVPFEAVAAFDIDPIKRANAEEKGLKAYDNLEDFLAAGGYDLVLVGTANNYHCEMACRAMEAGYNVMVEKPAARNAEELEKMIETAERTGKLFTVHHNRRWDPDYMIIKQMLAENCVGKPYMIESRIHSANGNGDRYGWRAMTDHGGGMLLDWGVHMLDQILCMVDEPVKTVSANVFSLWSEEVDDYAKVILTFGSGLVAQMEVVTYSPLTLPRWAVYGNRGAAIMDDMSSPSVHIRRIREDTNTREMVNGYVDYQVIQRDQSRHKIQEFEEFDFSDRPAGSWPSLYQNLAGVLDGTEELIVKPRQVLACMKVIDAAFKSSREGVTVWL